MKKLTITLLFSAFNILCFAQMPFTEKMVHDMSLRLINESAKFCKDDLAPTFVIIGSEGGAVNYEQITKLIMESKQISRVLTDVKIKQYGKMATATGSLVHVFNLGKGDIIANERFTYIHEFNNGKWQIVHAQHTPIQPVNDNLEAVAKQWISDYNKDDVAFFKDKITEDFVGTNWGSPFFDRQAVLREGRKSTTNDSEILVVKSLQSGNVGLVTGVMTYHHRQPDGSDNADKVAYTFGMVKQNGKWMYATHQFAAMIQEKPEEVLNVFLAEYHKNPKTFFENRLPDDFRFLNGGKENVPKAGVISNSTNDPTDSEVSDVKAFQSGNLGVVSGFHVFKNRQADGNIRADKVAFTYTFQKKNGKWFFAESHQTPVKE